MEGTPSGVLMLIYYAMAEYLSVVLEGFCFTYTKLWNAPKPGSGVFLFASLKPYFLSLCISFSKAGKGTPSGLFVFCLHRN